MVDVVIGAWRRHSVVCGDASRRVYGAVAMPRFAEVKAPRGTHNPLTRRPRPGGQTPECRRDKSYDEVAHGNGEDCSVYVSTCFVPLNRGRGRCEGCHSLRDLFNGYCDLCRALGANE